MGSRTYLPTLLYLAKAIRAYCARYDQTIRKNMSSEIQAVYDVLLAALDDLVAILTIPEGE